MADTVVAERYAKAFFLATRSQKVEDKSQHELNRLVHLIRTDANLSKLLRHPLLPLKEKKRHVTEALGGPMSPMFERFLETLLKKKRLGLLPRIAGSFESLADAAQNRRKVHIKSAVALSKEQLKEWETKLARVWGGEVRVEASVDENLLGGVVVRLGDRVWDQSLGGQLKDLKENLLESAKN